MKKHILREHLTNKIFTISLLKNKVTIEKTNKGKIQVTEKEFLTEEEAQAFFFKQEHAMLKKDYVLYNESAQMGEPVLYYFTASVYKACLSFENTPNGIFLYKHGSYAYREDVPDYIICIDTLGNLKKTIELPLDLPWSINYNNSNHSLLLDFQKKSYEYFIDNDEFKELNQKNVLGTGFLSYANGVIVYIEDDEIIAQDNDNIILKRKFILEKDFTNEVSAYAKISASGNLLALHTKTGEIEIIHLKTGKTIKTVAGSFERVREMEFVNDDREIIVLEREGRWRIYFFSLENFKEIEYPDMGIPMLQISSFCLNKDQSILIVVQGSNVYIFDFKNKRKLHHFRVDHYCRHSTVKFINNLLGLRDDGGLFRIYKI